MVLEPTDRLVECLARIMRDDQAASRDPDTADEVGLVGLSRSPERIVDLARPRGLVPILR